MESLYLLIPLGVVTVVGFAGIFIAAALNGQFEELDRQQLELPDDE
ncbi:cbb3-type cytochrome oxidase maturation protein [Panacagrimonas perspica]|uniref:Cbb3-type cytochrome oxidase maturation protein n=1 Tax=Panacagrimonas perspica TaxID=381431 RepID=A0A4V3F675_9GAMM|nr:cbb3-type cytochrome oxidase assembly protein [Panacagrimonas perspica]TDU31646.1 cbb3-type cytochrome oxidase maturation protein [Panacagrimonas perspica]